MTTRKSRRPGVFPFLPVDARPCGRSGNWFAVRTPDATLLQREIRKRIEEIIAIKRALPPPPPPPPPGKRRRTAKKRNVPQAGHSGKTD